ncbi:MAG: hypothetical protein J1G30_06980 [Spirochaetales bacterium]|nr:hypothetical protein [Spirochaetales bacterium]
MVAKVIERDANRDVELEMLNEVVNEMIQQGFLLEFVRDFKKFRVLYFDHISNLPNAKN